MAQAYARRPLAGRDFSGPFFFSGRQFSRMLRFAVDEVNAAGGLLGRQVEIVAPDAQTNMQLHSFLTP